MNSKGTNIQISQEKLLDFVRAMVGGSVGREDDEHPLPPGPWDPVIRLALKQIHVFGPHPEPWQQTQIGNWITSGPQPEPWRIAFFRSLAQAVIDRAELMQEISDNMKGEGGHKGKSVASSYLSKFADEYCGTGYKIRFRWPFPWPFPDPDPVPHPDWFSHELDSIDLIVLATQFEQAAKETFNKDLQQNLADAGAQFAQAGLSKLQ